MARAPLARSGGRPAGDRVRSVPMPAGAVALLLSFFLFLGAAPAAGEELRTPSPAAKATCNCAAFDAELAQAKATYASREEGIAMPLTPVMHDLYRARVDATFGRAACLAGCSN